MQHALRRETTKFEVAQFGYMGLWDAEKVGDPGLRQLPML